MVTELLVSNSISEVNGEPGSESSDKYQVPTVMSPWDINTSNIGLIHRPPHPEFYPYFIIRNCFALTCLSVCQCVQCCCCVYTQRTSNMIHSTGNFYPLLTPSPAYWGGCIRQWSFLLCKQVLEVVWHLLQMSWKHTGWAINWKEVGMMFLHKDLLDGIQLLYIFSKHLQEEALVFFVHLFMSLRNKCVYVFIHVNTNSLICWTYGQYKTQPVSKPAHFVWGKKNAQLSKHPHFMGFCFSSLHI